MVLKTLSRGVTCLDDSLRSALVSRMDPQDIFINSLSFSWHCVKFLIQCCLSLLNQSMILLPGYNGFICLVASDFPPLNFKDFPLFFL